MSTNQPKAMSREEITQIVACVADRYGSIHAQKMVDALAGKLAAPLWCEDCAFPSTVREKDLVIAELQTRISELEAAPATDRLARVVELRSQIAQHSKSVDFRVDASGALSWRVDRWNATWKRIPCILDDAVAVGKKVLADLKPEPITVSQFRSASETLQSQPTNNEAWTIVDKYRKQQEVSK